MIQLGNNPIRQQINKQGPRALEKKAPLFWTMYICAIWSLNLNIIDKFRVQCQLHIFEVAVPVSRKCNFVENCTNIVDLNKFFFRKALTYNNNNEIANFFKTCKNLWHVKCKSLYIEKPSTCGAVMRFVKLNGDR